MSSGTQETPSMLQTEIIKNGAVSNVVAGLHHPAEPEADRGLVVRIIQTGDCQFCCCFSDIYNRIMFNTLLKIRQTLSFYCFRRDWRWSASPSPPPDHSDLPSHHPSSTRSYASTSRSHRKRTVKQTDKYGSDRNRGYGSERSRTKARKSEENEYLHSRKYQRRTPRKVDAFKSKDHVDNERINHQRVDDDLHKLAILNSDHDVNVMVKKPCDISFNLSPRDCVAHEDLGQTQTDLHFEEKGSSSSNVRIKDKKEKKKRKEKDSHRKEKKRKKKSRVRSDSSHSSDVQD